MTDATEKSPAGYNSIQIILHWAIAVLVLFQVFVHEGIEHGYDAIMEAEPSTPANMFMANVHVYIGITIFLLAVWRVAVRFKYGAPPLPADEPPVLQFVAKATHFLLYALILGMPLSGATAWFLKAEAAAELHEIAKSVLIALVLLHTAAALAHHFIFKRDTLMRMLKPVNKV